MSKFIVIVLALSLFSAGSASGQDHLSDIKVIERAAAKAAVARPTGAPGETNPRVVINPLRASAGDLHPSNRGTTASPDRNSALRQALSARELPRSSVFTCGERYCQMRDADVFLTLAEPVIDGDRAQVFVIIERQFTMPGKDRPKLYFETVKVLLERQQQGKANWRVTATERVVIS